MSVSHYLFSKTSKEYIHLGCRGRRSDFEYEGPTVWVGTVRSRLPRDLLQTLVERFREAHGADDVIICSFDDLFDSTEYLAEHEMGTEVGGERDDDLPLAKYLPELDDPSVRDEIRSNTHLHIEPSARAAPDGSVNDVIEQDGP